MDGAPLVFIYLIQLFFSIPALQCPLLGNFVHRVIDNLFGYSEKAIKFEKKIPLKKFDATK